MPFMIEFHNFGENVSHATVKIVKVDNVDSVFDQGCRISNSLETHGLKDNVL
jgi:hypothetical protein